MRLQFLQQYIRRDLIRQSAGLCSTQRSSYLKQNIGNKEDGQGGVVFGPRGNVKILLQSKEDSIADVDTVPGISERVLFPHHGCFGHIVTGRERQTNRR
jgi:hypothetical protein